MSRLLLAACLSCVAPAGFAAAVAPAFPTAASEAAAFDAASPESPTHEATPAEAAMPDSDIPSVTDRAVADHDARHDFDFLAGRWHAHSRRLTRPLDPGADAWEEFDSVHDGVLLPSGFGVADDFRIPARPEFVGLALQLFDEATGRWQAYWYRNGVLTASLVGRFVDGVGVFEGPDTHEGRPIRTRYTWSRITPRSARWEQAYSVDDGRTWETNWVMDYRRMEAE